MEKPVLNLEHVTHVYGEGTPFRTAAIEDVSLKVYPGEFLCLVGHTGSGKSTLIQHMNGLMRPTSGTVRLDGEDVFASKKTLLSARFRVGLVFQYPEHQLFEETIYKDIAYGPGNMGLTGEEIRRRVLRAAGFAGIREDMLEKSPFDLSGGEKRRVAIAGVIAMEPEVLVLDEPLAGLDPNGCRGIMDRLHAYHEATGAAVVLVTHSMDEAARSGSRIAVMNRGRLVMDGSAKEIFSRAGELEEMGLSVPEVTKVALELEKLGIPVCSSVYTVEQAAAAIAALRGRHGKC